jgi:2-aminobenzoate-CoA ligase
VLGPSGHIDTFTRDNLPPSDQWPDMLLEGFEYPEWLNCGYELTDAMVAKGFGDHTALIGNGRIRTYKELTDWTNRIAHVLVEDYGVKPGNRVLIRSANNPAMVAVWLAATKAGAVVVNTMPMLRAVELGKIVDKAEISLALCDTRLMDEMVACAKESRFITKVVGFDGTANHDAELDRLALSKPVRFETVKTGRDDVALLGFTSGTTGMPKATMHFHRDMLIIADGYAKEVLGVTPEDVFVGSPPLAFTFGLGGLAVFPLRFGAAAVLLEQASPANMVEIIQTHKATVCFTAPTAYRAMLAAMEEGADLSARCARRCRRAKPCPGRSMSTGWPRPASRCLTGSAPPRCCTSSSPTGSTTHSLPAPGKPVSGYEARIVDGEDERSAPRRGRPAGGARPDRLPLPLGSEQQQKYVRDGWNLTGDVHAG